MPKASWHTSYVGMTTWVHARGEWRRAEVTKIGRKWVTCMIYDLPYKRFRRAWNEVWMRNPTLQEKDKPSE